MLTCVDIAFSLSVVGLCVKCSKYQQLKLAKYCEELLDEYLLRRPLDSMPVTSASSLVLCLTAVINDCSYPLDAVLHSLWGLVEGFFGYTSPKPERIWMKPGIQGGPKKPDCF